MKKTLLLACIALISTLIFISCSKDGDQGPAGPEGPAGPQGPQGIQGNANVTQYTFGAHNFATNGTASLQVTTTADTMNRSALFVYLVRASGNVYPIPGFGLNGSSDYRVYWNHTGDKVNVTVNKVAGTGEEYSNIRIIRVYANTATVGMRMNQVPDIDYTDYYSVCKYFKLSY